MMHQDAGIIDCMKKFFSVRGGIQAGGVHVGAHVYGVCIIDSSSSAKGTINALFIPQSREDVASDDFARRPDATDAYSCFWPRRYLQ